MTTQLLQAQIDSQRDLIASYDVMIAGILAKDETLVLDTDMTQLAVYRQRRQQAESDLIVYLEALENLTYQQARSCASRAEDTGILAVPSQVSTGNWGVACFPEKATYVEDGNVVLDAFFQGLSLEGLV